jgi:hypothetical protein
MTGLSTVSYAEGPSTDEQVSLLTPITVIVFPFSWPRPKPALPLLTSMIHQGIHINLQQDLAI